MGRHFIHTSRVCDQSFQITALDIIFDYLEYKFYLFILQYVMYPFYPAYASHPIRHRISRHKITHRDLKKVTPIYQYEHTSLSLDTYQSIISS